MSDWIVVVDDDPLSLKVAGHILGKNDMQVTTLGSGKELVDFMRENRPDLILLDIMLPGIDGFNVCSKIREASNTPIIILSAKTDKEDKLNGIILGADDYIEKPIDIDILIAKIKGIFKRRYDIEQIVEGELKLNIVKSILNVGNKEYELTTKECELLKILIQNKNTTLKKEYLFNTIWGSDSETEYQSLTVHIKWLREKIEENPKEPKHLITVWGVGYRFE